MLLKWSVARCASTGDILVFITPATSGEVLFHRRLSMYLFVSGKAENYERVYVKFVEQVGLDCKPKS